MATVTMNALAVGGTIQFAVTGTVVVPANGIITIQAADAGSALLMGCTYVNNRVGWQTFPVPPRAATAGRIVASTSTAIGSLTIANQPDVPRQVAVVLYSGTTNITAGVCTLTYTANDSTTQVDALSLIATASTNTTLTSTKGVVHLTSAVVSALAGGATSGIQINDTNSLSMMVDQGFVNFTALKETLSTPSVAADETIGTVASSAASITPSTAPITSTNNYGWAFSYVMPTT